MVSRHTKHTPDGLRYAAKSQKIAQDRRRHEQAVDDAAEAVDAARTAATNAPKSEYAAAFAAKRAAEDALYALDPNHWLFT